jgi:hypothetical protein
MLTDPSFVVPPVPDCSRGVGWLRANVARFSEGDDHRRRRGLATELLAGVDPAALRRCAARLDGPPSHVAVQVLADALGIPDVPVDAVVTVAAAYQPGTGDEAAADLAIEQLVETCGGVADERTAARIGLLVQACAATGALAAQAVRAGSVDAALAQEPPVPHTRRLDPVTNDVVLVDLTGQPFGAGRHECPGREHAIAIVDGLR